MQSDDSGATRSKVARVIDAYDLDGMGDRLVERWTGADGERASLRDLADEFNREVLRTAMREVGRSPMERVVEQTYETLTASDVSEGRKAEVRNQLTRDGVDVDALRGDFVSHQSVHTYLTSVREVTAPSSDSDPVETDVGTIQRLLGRTATVAEDTLERHRDAERVVLGDFDVFLDLRVLCHRCGSDRDVVTLLENGGCACDEPVDASPE
ncbi:rod-determining factor RdfA [Halosimplex aquaticum]|uniref:Rod-determining factor RdfA n=1 Tax=Halosimplex aquaticum TaxID=3026162 RepID=A0ABD5XZP6_9EURY|nr:rod-determining factor RdfA [Halosimplex aquaticum]